MLGQDSTLKMNSRGGLPVRNIVTAIFILLSIYLLYIYNVGQNRLHDSEMTGARYRKEVEERVNEIQDLVAGKDDYQERCENDKREMTNRLKSLNQKHTMLQNQNTEIEADFMKLKQDMENLRTEHMQTESQHAQEYQSLKQTKDKELQDVKDQQLIVKQQNEELQNTIVSLRSQIQNNEMDLQKALQMVENLQNAKKNLLDQNAQLQLAQFQQQKQLKLQQQNEDNAKQAKALQQQQQELNVAPEQRIELQNLKAHQPLGGDHNINEMSQDDQDDAHKVVDPKVEAEKIDRLNAMNQAKPPGLDNGVHIQDSAGDNKDGDKSEAGVNPNFPGKDQILGQIKHDGGEVDGEGHMNVREFEEKREREEMENQAPEHHKNPLALGQMQQPFDGNGGMEGNSQNKVGGLGQQQPPVLVEQDQKPGEDNAQEDEPRHFFRNREEDEGNLEGDDDDVGGVLDVPGEKEMDDQIKAFNHFNLGNREGEEENANIDDKYDDNTNGEKEIEEDEDEDDYGADDDIPRHDV